MCGIVGARSDWLRQRGLAPAVAMQAALARLRWRGPDGQAAVPAGPWWLGCTRLAITDARSRQPVVRSRGRFTAVSNGAVTDARDVWQQLWPAALRRRTLPNDAWLPLLAVERRQPERLGAFAGHRACAIVDHADGALYVAVDPAGEKPLFGLWHGRELVAFASSPAAFAAFGVVARLADETLAQWFVGGFAAPRFDALPDGLRLQEWPRQPAVTRIVPSGPPRTWPALPRAGRGDLRDTVRLAVARCVDVEVPVALSLSGGIDSSCLAASLAALQTRVPAYQFAAAGGDPGEREVARAVAAHCGLPWRPVDGGPEVLAALPELTAHAGLPLGDPSVLAVHALACAAARDGVRVLLGGEGADEQWLGYRRHRLARWWPWLRWLGCMGRTVSNPWRRRGRDRLAAAAAAGAGWYGTLAAVVPAGFLRSVLRVSPRPLALPAGARMAAVATWEWDHYLRHDLLPKVDVATMAAGVEARCPYLDPEVVAWTAAASPRARTGKRGLRQAFDGALPRAVFRQRKRGFALPLDAWFRGDLPWLDLLREPRTRQRPHLHPDGVGEAIDRHRRGAADLGHALYLLVAFELHLRATEATPCA